ncbi:MAG TPA: fumarylacetoacetate hydrolase family protein [Vicinamibacterales bacterium]|nr:fumarylacetoacetate hydrolase family protein [Vicinamibacterales bacterium]
MDRIYKIKQGSDGRYAVERDGQMFWLVGDVFGLYSAGEAVPKGDHAFLPPVTPSIVVCIGLNYKDHAAEMNKKLPAEPLVFLKPRSAVIGPGDEIRIPAWAGRIEHEAEMAVVIGKRASHVKAADAMNYVLGITCLNDVTARELQVKDVQYSRAKGFDTFCPIGPCIAVGLDPSALAIDKPFHGQRRHNSNTRELIFPVPYLVEHVSRFMTLDPGDIITTGTPSGVGPLTPGDRIEVKVEGVGTLSNPCVAANR